MNRSNAMFLVSSLVVFGACAHNSTATTPVALKLTSKNADSHFVSDVRKATLKSISNSVPQARPMTVIADLDVTTERVMTAPYAVTGGGSRQRTIASTSPDPSTDGALPAVPDNGFPASPESMDAVTEVRLHYTISDGSGRVIESDQTRFDSISHDASEVVVNADSNRRSIVTQTPLWSNRNIANATAAFLASRVKALSH
jgi:hypothetical protein